MSTKPAFVKWFKGPFRSGGSRDRGERRWYFLAVGNGRSVAVSTSKDPGWPHVCIYQREFVDDQWYGRADMCFEYHYPQKLIQRVQLAAVAAFFLKIDLEDFAGALQVTDHN